MAYSGLWLSKCAASVMYITDWPDGSPFHGYVFGLCVYSAIERTPAAHAFAKALDRRFGPDTSSIKRAEHILPNANEVGELIVEQGFHEVSSVSATSPPSKRSTIPRDQHSRGAFLCAREWPIEPSGVHRGPTAWLAM